MFDAPVVSGKRNNMTTKRLLRGCPHAYSSAVPKYREISGAPPVCVGRCVAAAWRAFSEAEAEPKRPSISRPLDFFFSSFGQNRVRLRVNRRLQ